MLNLGLIGTGVQGRRWINTFKDKANIVVACNTSGKSDLQLPCFNNHHQLLDFKKLDGIILAAHPSISVEIIRAANFLEIPVLAEKPVGLSLKEVNKLSGIKIPLLVNYTHLYNPHYQEMKQEIKSPITKIISIGVGHGPFRDYTSLYDYVPHDLSLCLDLVPGEMEIVSKKCIQAVNGMLYFLELKSGNKQFFIKCGNGAPEKSRKLAVFCENGDVLNWDDAKSTDYHAPMNNVANEFLGMICDKSKPSFNNTLQIQKLLYQLSKE